MMYPSNRRLHALVLAWALIAAGLLSGCRSSRTSTSESHVQRGDSLTVDVDTRLKWDCERWAQWIADADSVRIILPPDSQLCPSSGMPSGTSATITLYGLHLNAKQTAKDKADALLGTRVRASSAYSETAKEHTEEKTPARKWYETALARLGLGVCIAALLWVLFLYLRRKR